ncbi:MAG: thioredoxin [Clostridia bacterium]|nr:thioredoxin [Clostridia bacterium]
MSVIQMNTEMFRTYTTTPGKPVLVEFSAPWCVYCRRIAPALDKLAAQMVDTLPVGIINIDEEKTLAEQEQIEVVPTLILYRDGQALGSIVAPESKAQIESFIQETLAQ